MNVDTGNDDELLKNFMEEFFPFEDLMQVGFFTRDMKEDYEAQAKRVCDFFGYKTVYQYGAKEIRVHLSYAGERPKNGPFVTTLPSIYESI